MTTISDNLQIIGTKIEKHAEVYERRLSDIQLLAVSKKHPASSIRVAYAFGQKKFGENYTQELLEKAAQLKDLDIEWHFIGPLQTNKTKKIAEVANWVHAVDRLKIATRLNAQRPTNMPPLSICIQVNISGEESKSGVMPDDLEALAKDISKLPKLALRGLMAIPAPETDFEKQRHVFKRIHELKDQLCKKGYSLDTLSMGMTGDMEAAIAEGATIVRIGTAIFGARQT